MKIKQLVFAILVLLTLSARTAHADALYEAEDAGVTSDYAANETDTDEAASTAAGATFDNNSTTHDDVDLQPRGTQVESNSD